MGDEVGTGFWAWDEQVQFGFIEVLFGRFGVCLF